MMKQVRQSTAQTSKQCKALLRKKFNHTFSVRSEHGSLRISWTDGPSIEAVQFWASVYEGATLEQNGGDMIKGYKHDMPFDFGVDYVFCDRTLSPETEAHLKKYVLDKYGPDTSINQHVSERQIWELTKKTSAEDIARLDWSSEL